MGTDGKGIGIGNQSAAGTGFTEHMHLVWQLYRVLCILEL